MKVLVVTNMYPTLELPSLGTFVKTQVKSLKNVGLKVDVLFIDGVSSRWNYLKAFFMLRNMLHRQQFDLVHAHYGLTGMISRLQWKCPLIISFTGDDVFGTPQAGGHYSLLSLLVAHANRVLARLADVVIVKSRAMKTKLGYSKAHVIANGVDFDQFRPLPERKSRVQLGLDVDKQYVLFAGNPSVPVKRFDVVKAALQIVQTCATDVELLTVHSVPHKMMPVYMNAADVLILTSQHEGSPNVIKEAMACELPIVAVDVGDVREVIGGTDRCFVVARNSEAVAEKLKYVLSRVGRSNGRSRITHLSLTEVAKRLISIYEDAVPNS